MPRAQAGHGSRAFRSSLVRWMRYRLLHPERSAVPGPGRIPRHPRRQEHSSIDPELESQSALRRGRPQTESVVRYGNTTASERPASSAMSIARMVVVPNTNPCWVTPASKPRCVRTPAAPTPLDRLASATQVSTAEPESPGAAIRSPDQYVAFDQQIAELGDAMLPILPQLMRGERVIELAQAANAFGCRA